MSDDLNDFLTNLRSGLLDAAKTQAVTATKSHSELELDYICRPAPNAIEWAVGDEYLNVDSVYHHVRQYQILRDFFQLRCPMPTCNNQSAEAKDCWGKGREYLQSENLLVWSEEYKEDICPHCRLTRSELAADGLLNLYNQLHIIAGMRCIPGDSRIHTNKGMVQIKSLFPTNVNLIPDTFYKIDNLYVEGINGTEQATDLYYAGKSKYHVLTLEKGIEIKGSWKHPVYANKNGIPGWYKLQDLSPGDKIQVSSGIWNGNDNTIDSKLINHCESRKISSSKYLIPNVINKDLAHILGYLTAEGQCNREFGVRFTNGDVETINHFLDLCDKTFGIRPNCYEGKGLTYDLNGIGIRVLLDKLGLEHKNAHSKTIPNSIWRTSRDIASEFLKAYFEGDGTAAIDNNGKPAVAAYTVSKQMAYDLIDMLWALDVRASITRTKSRRFGTGGSKFDHDAYSIRIYGIEILKFAENIGFLSSRKINALNECVDKIKSSKYNKRKNYLIVKSNILSDDEIDLFDLHVPGTHSFSTGIVMNHNSGKSATASIMGTYIEHRALNVAHTIGLDKFFGQMSRQPFEIAMIAATEVQAADTIWARYTGLRSESPWIKRYIKFIKSEELKQTTQLGAKPWEYVEHGKDIIHGFANLKIVSLNSNSNGLAGRTRIASIIDELARFDSSDSSRSADEAYRVLENSLRTIRSKSVSNKEIPWMGTMISISSPISEEDKAMKLLKDAPRIKSMYSGHYATWDFNPDQPREMFDDDFEKDPIGAMRDFGARPPTAASPLVQDPNRFREMAIQPDLKPTAQFIKQLHVDTTGREYISAKITDGVLSRNGERYIAFDAGSTFDQFAGACAHGEWVDTPEGKQLITVFDWVTRLLPENKPKRDVWFDFVISTIDYLQKFYFISRVEFDRWQSTYLIQQIRNRGIMCEMKSTTSDMFNKFMNDVNYSKVRMLPPMPDDNKLDPPQMSAQGLAFYELERLERSSDLKRIFNPKKGERRGWNSDDVATTVVHASDMVQSSVIDINNSNSPLNRLKREMVGGHQSDSIGKIFKPRLNKRGW